MLIRVLGAHNAESATTSLAGITVDGRIALDAGSLTRSLTAREQAAIRHVFLTHRHYDHVRDVPALVFGTPHAGTVHVYGLPDTLQALTDHLLNNVIYSAYHTRANEDGTPRAALHPVAPGERAEVDDFTVTPIAVRHTAPSVGYLVERGGRRIFYTGDTGPGFGESLAQRLPDVLLTEVTYGNDAAATATRNGHMTPAFLREEVARMVASTGWRPRIVVVHVNPPHQSAIEAEIAALRQETGWDMTIGHADMTFEV